MRNYKLDNKKVFEELSEFSKANMLETLIFDKNCLVDCKTLQAVISIYYFHQYGFM